MRILFQGDSITDAGRSYSDNKNLGFGYARLVEASLGFDEPNHEFFNRGISGMFTQESSATLSILSPI